MRVRHPSIEHHFARVATRYRRIRELDFAAVRQIARIIKRLPKSESALMRSLASLARTA